MLNAEELLVRGCGVSGRDLSESRFVLLRTTLLNTGIRDAKAVVT